MPSANDLFPPEPVEGRDHLYVANVFSPEGEGANNSSTKKISEDVPSKPTEDTVVEEESTTLTVENVCMEGEDQFTGKPTCIEGSANGKASPHCKSPCLLLRLLIPV